MGSVGQFNVLLEWNVILVFYSGVYRIWTRYPAKTAPEGIYPFLQPWQIWLILILWLQLQLNILYTPMLLTKFVETLLSLALGWYWGGSSICLMYFSWISHFVIKVTCTDENCGVSKYDLCTMKILHNNPYWFFSGSHEAHVMIYWKIIGCTSVLQVIPLLAWKKYVKNFIPFLVGYNHVHLLGSVHKQWNL